MTNKCSLIIGINFVFLLLLSPCVFFNKIMHVTIYCTKKICILYNTYTCYVFLRKNKKNQDMI